MKCESRVPKASRKTASYGLYFQSYLPQWIQTNHPLQGLECLTLWFHLESFAMLCIKHHGRCNT